VLTTRDTLRGVADATWTSRGRSARLLGTFELQRDRPTSVR
jgi:hypothetical protein